MEEIIMIIMKDEINKIIYIINTNRFIQYINYFNKT